MSATTSNPTPVWHRIAVKNERTEYHKIPVGYRSSRLCKIAGWQQIEPVADLATIQALDLLSPDGKLVKILHNKT